LIKNKSDNGQKSESEEEEYDTLRMFKSIDQRQITKSNDMLNNISNGMNITDNSIMTYREQRSFKEDKKMSTPKASTTFTKHKTREILGAHMEQMIENELDIEYNKSEREKQDRQNSRRRKKLQFKNQDKVINIWLRDKVFNRKISETETHFWINYPAD